MNNYFSAMRNVSMVLVFFICISMCLPHPAEARKVTPQPPSPALALSFLRAQIKASGLIDSFVEDQRDDSYTYDNALAAMAFISAGDFNSARRLLDAFVAIRPEPSGGFLHRYHATDGSPNNGILRAGHNAYLLQAINLYYRETGDSRYNSLAEQIAGYLLSLQDSDGGIFGSSQVTWKSTENNLAVFSAIYNFGVVRNDPYYMDKAGQIRNFIVTECWNGVRFLCGENDPVIVTDVQALGCMILGPDYKNGAYWIESYTLTTKRYSGRKSITGFDMNTDRDTVWTEGTLQESMAFLAAGSSSKYSFYKTESEKLFKASGALLLASNTGTTGFDWTFQPWQAVAPTAWYIYACNQDNVLELLK